MAEYTVLLTADADAFLTAADEKTEQIVRRNLGYLAENPYPGRGQGDKAKETIDGEEVWRIHISRTYTAIYAILEDNKEVRVRLVTDIDTAHKLYD